MAVQHQGTARLSTLPAANDVRHVVTGRERPVRHPEPVKHLADKGRRLAHVPRRVGTADTQKITQKADIFVTPVIDHAAELPFESRDFVSHVNPGRGW